VVKELNNVSFQMSLPKPELLSFSGNPIDYNKFIHNFNTNICAKVEDPYVKLNYLIQFCKGDARECIEECVLFAPGEGFSRAKQILYILY
jgi:hypothetical protein